MRFQPVRTEEAFKALPVGSVVRIPRGALLMVILNEDKKRVLEYSGMTESFTFTFSDVESLEIVSVPSRSEGQIRAEMLREVANHKKMWGIHGEDDETWTQRWLREWAADVNHADPHFPYGNT